MFSENHKRYLLNALRHIDKLLTEAADKLNSGDGHRLFPEYIPDATPAQKKVLRDYMESMRFILGSVMERHGLVAPESSVSALWAFRTSLTFARIAVEELRPEYMRGYGDLTPEDEAETLRFVADLHVALQRIVDYLRSGEGGDLSTRLARLESTRNEVQLLRELEAIVDRHGLVEFRRQLADLTSRLETSRYEIAFFGPVSAGKSSLLNAIIDMPVLPVGVTPVTSVVTRLCYGNDAHLRVRFASEPAVDAPIEHIADYVTEDMNPANAKQVVDVRAELPVDLLHGGLHLIDTPGLGSLAAAGAIQTLAYLPRCDLAVMLIDGTGRLSREDLAIARSVVESGTELLLVLSKADLVSDQDREKQVRYVQRQFREALGLDMRVTPVSAAQAHRELATHWIESELTPRIERLRDLMDVSLRRKIAVLRESVTASLLARMDTGSVSPSKVRDMRASADHLIEIRADIAAARREIDDVCFALAGKAGALIDRAAASVARASAASIGIAEAAAEIIRELSSVAEGLHEQLDLVRKRAEDALLRVNEQTAGALAEKPLFPPPSGCPLFDAAIFRVQQPVALPSWTMGFPALKQQWLRRQLHRRWDARFRDALSAYGAALRKWSGSYLNELSQLFDADAASFENKLRMAGTGGLDGEHIDRAAIERDIAQLSR